MPGLRRQCLHVPLQENRRSCVRKKRYETQTFGAILRRRPAQYCGKKNCCDTLLSIQGVDRLFAPCNLVAARSLVKTTLRSAPGQKRRAHSSCSPWSLHAGCVGASRAHCAGISLRSAQPQAEVQPSVWCAVLYGVVPLWCVVCGVACGAY